MIILSWSSNSERAIWKFFFDKRRISLISFSVNFPYPNRVSVLPQPRGPTAATKHDIPYSAELIISLGSFSIKYSPEIVGIGAPSSTVPSPSWYTYVLFCCIFSDEVVKAAHIERCSNTPISVMSKFSLSAEPQLKEGEQPVVPSEVEINEEFNTMCDDVEEIGDEMPCEQDEDGSAECE